MRRTTCSDHTPTRLIPAEVLDGLAHHLASAHHLEGGPPHAVRVRCSADRTVDLATAPLPSDAHPVDALVGITVPRSWSAAGLVVAGRAWTGLVPHPHAGIAAPAPGVEPEAHRVSMALVVDRSGHVAHHTEGIDPIDEAPEGRAVDLVRRSLGLDTPPPTTPAAEWWRARWLDGIVTAAALEPSAPVPSTLVGTFGATLVRTLVDDPSLCEVRGWASLRRLAAATDAPDDPGRAAVREVLHELATPADAAWMDDGCFSRWMLESLPAIEELLPLVDVLLPPDDAAAVHAALVPGATSEGVSR